MCSSFPTTEGTYQFWPSQLLLRAHEVGLEESSRPDLTLLKTSGVFRSGSGGCRVYACRVYLDKRCQP